MRRFLATIVLLLLTSSPAFATEGLITVRSQFPVAETLDRFENAVRSAGMTVFARIDHAEGAQSVGLELAPSQLLVFGNPKVGTLLMQSNARIGQELPLRVLAWQDADGTVWLSYPDPEGLLQRFGIADRPKIRQKLTGALAGFADTAVKP
jgi:uncharacterized protein (DUF302 family)